MAFVGHPGFRHDRDPRHSAISSATTLNKRLKAVSERREELRAKHHAALNAKRGSPAHRADRGS